MTEAQRNYLADLAGRKGVRLEDTDEKSVAWASSKIEELKALPDANFDAVTEEEAGEIDKLTNNVLTELKRWNFQK